MFYRHNSCEVALGHLNQRFLLWTSGTPSNVFHSLTSPGGIPSQKESPFFQGNAGWWNMIKFVWICKISFNSLDHFPSVNLGDCCFVLISSTLEVKYSVSLFPDGFSKAFPLKGDHDVVASCDKRFKDSNLCLGWKSHKGCDAFVVISCTRSMWPYILSSTQMVQTYLQFLEFCYTILLDTAEL